MKQKELDCGIYAIINLEENMFWRREFWGAVLLIVGIILLLSNLDFIDYSFRKIIHDFWPVLIILLGILLIVNSLRKKEGNHDYGFDLSTDCCRHSGKKHSHVFGDVKLEAKDTEIDGLESSTVFGNTFLSLAGAKLKPGQNRINIATTFGDITVIVPERMEASASASATFGNLHVFDKMADGISNRLSAQTSGYEVASSKIQISAAATFGEIRIYRG